MSDYPRADFTTHCLFRDVAELNEAVVRGVRPGINAEPFLFCGQAFPPGTLTAEEPRKRELEGGGFEVVFVFTYQPQEG